MVLWVLKSSLSALACRPMALIRAPHVASLAQIVLPDGVTLSMASDKRGALSKLAKRGALANARPTDALQSPLSVQLRAHVANVLSGWSQAGLDSLGAVELRSAISARFAIDAPATLAFDYPTVAALVGFVAALLAPAPSVRLQTP